MAIKTFLLSSIALLTAMTGVYLLLNTSNSNDLLLKKFLEHKRKYRKVHLTKEDLEYRFSVYSKNMELIEKHNASNKSYKMGENQFTDLTFEEFSKKFIFKREKINLTSYSNEKPEKGEVDWTLKGMVSKVKNQLNCGASWSFAVTGVVESAYAIHKGISIDLSEQELIDCSHDYGNDGCYIGNAIDSFKYIKDNKIGKEADYPYIAGHAKCNINKGLERYSISSFARLNSPDVAELAKAIKIQPVAVSIDAWDDFRHYKSGIYSNTNEECGEYPGYEALVVGYKITDDESTNYFKLKTAWGENWGEHGYIRVLVGSGSGTCGIANYLDGYPIIE